MDVNGLPMWVLAGAKAFGMAGTSSGAGHVRDLEWNAERSHLTLASQQDRPVLAEDESFARLMISQPSAVADAADTFAWFNPATHVIEASGFAPGMTALHLGPNNMPEVPIPIPDPSDMALGAEQILYIARDGAVIFRD